MLASFHCFVFCTPTNTESRPWRTSELKELDSGSSPPHTQHLIASNDRFPDQQLSQCRCHFRRAPLRSSDSLVGAQCGPRNRVNGNTLGPTQKGQIKKDPHAEIMFKFNAIGGLIPIL